MSELIVYLLKVILIHGALFLFYRLFLRNSARHALNRYYLLSALVFAFVIPFISLPADVSSISEVSRVPIIQWMSHPTVMIENTELVPVIASDSLSLWSYVPYIYAIITSLLLLRSIFFLLVLKKMKGNARPIPMGWFTLFKTTHEHPFSFLSDVFIPGSLFKSASFQTILTHECVHVKQRHSVDRLLLDFLVSLFWFNPFIYLYRNALIEIHEYQADEAVVEHHQDPIGYQEILFSQLQTPLYSGIVSHFNVKLIKKRIVMMNTKTKKPVWLYACAAPITLLLIFSFSRKEITQPIEEVSEELTYLMEPDDPTEGFDALMEANIPSVLPLRNAEHVRLSSGYGMRMHPLLKVEKMHLGVDFSCKQGTEVIATADGVVEEVATKPGGYGKYIIINHGDGYKTNYAQLSEFKVSIGDDVKQGQVIALTGDSGASTAPHLHYEVIRGDRHVNPMGFIQNFKSVSSKKKPSGSSSVSTPNRPYRVVVDAGHGGDDPGALSPNGLKESDVALRVARHVGDNLDKKLIEIVYTRIDDRFVSLKERAKIVEGADLFISIHTDNYSDKEESFMLPIFYDGNAHSAKSLELANMLSTEFNTTSKVGATYEYKPEQLTKYDLLGKADCPAVLLYVGFFSHDEEEKYLSSANAGKEIAQGIERVIERALL